ncbi:MAG: hypothetical protein AABM42_02185 [Actinomycetota bacterium]
MAYVIVNELEGGTRELYDAAVRVVHPPGDSGFPGAPKTTQFEVEVSR